MSTILVVDDEESIRILFREELEEEGYKVITAENGVKALEMIKRERPDLVTLDIKMPGEDGLEILREIREIDYNLPVIICSAYSTFKTDFSTVAANYYLVKSSELGELKKKIKQILNMIEESDS